MSYLLIKNTAKCSSFLLNFVLSFILLFRIIRILLLIKSNQFYLLLNLNNYIILRIKILRKIRIKIKTSLKQALIKSCKNLNKVLSKIIMTHLQISFVLREKCLFFQRKNVINITKIIFILVAVNLSICPRIATQKIKIKTF